MKKYFLGIIIAASVLGGCNTSKDYNGRGYTATEIIEGTYPGFKIDEISPIRKQIHCKKNLNELKKKIEISIQNETGDRYDSMKKFLKEIEEARFKEARQVSNCT